MPKVVNLFPAEHAERGKLFNDGNFIKECMMEAENGLCPEKAALFGTISHSACSIV